MEAPYKPFGQAIDTAAEWDSPMFNLAQEQFLSAANIIDLDTNVRNRLLYPQRSSMISFPCRQDGYDDVVDHD